MFIQSGDVRFDGCTMRNNTAVRPEQPYLLATTGRSLALLTRMYVRVLVARCGAVLCALRWQQYVSCSADPIDAPVCAR